MSYSTFHTGDVVMYDGPEVHLWRVQGIPGCLYPNKIVAEAAARIAYPNESVHARHSRLSYKIFVPQD